MQSSLRVLSLFSGCGGMDLGMEGDFEVLAQSVNPALRWKTRVGKKGFLRLPRTCFQTVFANDIRQDAFRAYSTYFSKRSPVDYYLLGSIVDLVKRQKQGESIFPAHVDLITGGFPCQDFSVAGKRNGFDSHRAHDGQLRSLDIPTIESRGQLYIWMRSVIELTNPKMFIAENVKGLTNLKDTKKIIEHDFSTVGSGFLVLNSRILNASDFGVPQNRERVIFYGFNKRFLKEQALEGLQSGIPDYDPYPQPSHTNNSNANLWDFSLQSSLTNNLAQHVCAYEALADLPEPDESQDLSQKSYSKARFMGIHCQGQTEIPIDRPAPTIRSEHHGNIEYRRLGKEHGGKFLEELKAGKPERRLTVRECARLQTFPDDYQFVSNQSGNNVSSSSAYKIIGNAVPPLLAFHIAMRLQKNWTLYFGEEK